MGATLADLVTLAAIIRGLALFQTDLGRLIERFAFVVREGQRAGFWDAEIANTLLAEGPTSFIEGASCPSE